MAGNNRIVNRAEVLVSKLHRQIHEGKDSDFSQVPLTGWHQYKVDFEGTIRGIDSDSEEDNALIDVSNQLIIVPEHARADGFKIEEGKKYHIFDMIYTKKKYIWKIDERTIDSSDKSISNLNNNNTKMASLETLEGVLSDFKVKKEYKTSTYIDGNIDGKPYNFKMKNENVPLLVNGIPVKLILFGGKDWVMSKEVFANGTPAVGNTPPQNNKAESVPAANTTQSGSSVADAEVVRIQSIGIVGDSTKFDEYKLTLDKEGSICKAYFYLPQGNDLTIEEDKTYKFTFTETKEGLKAKIYREPKAATGSFNTSNTGNSGEINTFIFGSSCNVVANCMAAGITDPADIRNAIKIALDVERDIRSGNM